MENSGLVRRWLSWLPLQSSSGTRKKGRWVLWGVILSLKLTMPPFLIEISPLGIDAESGRTGVPWLANSHIGQIHTSVLAFAALYHVPVGRLATKAPDCGGLSLALADVLRTVPVHLQAGGLDLSEHMVVVLTECLLDLIALAQALPPTLAFQS
eukprot:479549-Amorphochlora_amoeboformis.AAC.1